APSAFGQLLCAIDFHLSSPYEIAIIGAPDAEGTRKLTSVVFSHYLPNKVIAVASPKDKRSIKAIKLLEGRTQINGQATAYVCHNYYCEAPVTEPEKLAEQLGV
ncbi:MAG TPA: thioredoxin domain-containing protein, partial [Blastocatellia bacterium]|nr:thioredoxin domain-containing protein [Blastocatellia bacterium]